MKALFYLLLFVLCPIALHAQPDPDLEFADVSKTYGDQAFTLKASSPSAGAISYSIIEGSEFISLSGNRVTIEHAGSAVIRATIAANGDYDQGTKDATLTINKRAISIGFDGGPSTLTYGDSYSPNNGWYRVENGSFADGDNISTLSNYLVINCEVERNSYPDAGVYPLSLIYSNDAGDYDVTTKGGQLTVNAYRIKMSIDSKTREYGEENPVFTFDFPDHDLKRGDTKESIQPRPQFECDADNSSPVETYTISLEKTTNPNWNYIFFTEEEARLTITRASLEVVILWVSRYYREARPALKGALIKGLKNGETLNVVKRLGEPVSYSGDTISGADIGLEFSSEPNSAAGLYAIYHNSLLISDNYTFHYEQGYETIKPVPLTIRILDRHKLVGEPNPSFDHSYVWPDYIKVRTLDASIASSIRQYESDCETGSPSRNYVIKYPDGSRPSDSNYQFEILNGILFVHDLPQISGKPEPSGACRDEEGALTIEAIGYKLTYEWWVKFPGHDFIPINNEIKDSLGLSGLRERPLVIRESKPRFLDYSFQCKVTSGFNADPNNSGSEYYEADVISGEARIRIDATPWPADVSLKGESILMCHDLNATTDYQWEKGGQIIYGATNSYLDIGDDFANRNAYRVRTINSTTSCSAVSDLETEDGYISPLVPYVPGVIELTVYPVPINHSAGVINIRVVKHGSGEYKINLYNHKGSRVVAPIVKEAWAGVPIEEEIDIGSNMLPGIYFVEFIQSYGRDVQKFLIYDN